MSNTTKYLAFAVIGGAFGQLFMKTGMSLAPTLVNEPFAIATQHFISFALFMLLGIVLYLLAMLAWLFALKNVDLSFAYPILSLGYIVVYLLASVWPGLNETLTTQKSLGVIVIVLGVWVSSLPEKKVKSHG